MYGPERNKIEFYGDRVHLDSTLAPRVHQPWYGADGFICWASKGKTQEERSRITYRSEECPQGQFLLHHLDNGFTAIQWWDRCQGDTRGACNSTILLEGEHDAATMLAALAEHFPHVLENLKKAGVELVEIKKP